VKTLAAALLVLALLAGCGGGGGSGTQTVGTKVSLTEYKFNPKDISVQSGKATFTLVNTGTTGHDMTVADSSGKVIAKSEVVQAGDTKVFTIDNLPAGKYVIYCDLPGHRSAGMEGTLTAT
jgi:plastocyanin